MRKLLGAQNIFLVNYIIDKDLLSHVVDVYLKNNAKYNILDSVVIEMFKFIGTAVSLFLDFLTICFCV